MDHTPLPPGDTVYLRVENGAVIEMYQPPDGIAITDIFAPPQVWVERPADSSAMPGWTATQAGDVWTFTPPSPLPPLTLAQQAVMALGQGLAVSSSGNPELDATYACDPGQWVKVMAISQYVAVNGTFPNKQTSLPMKDMAGTPHTFPSTTVFQSFATAVGDYVTALNLIIDGTSSATTLPQAAVVID